MDPRPVMAIVGAGPGNGAAIARRFAAAGYRVALIGRDSGRLTALAAGVERARAYVADAADRAALAAAFAAIGAELGQVSVLVHNAGHFIRGDALTVSEADFRASWEVTTLGAFLAVRQVLPGMLAAGSGAIVLVGATASRRGGPLSAAFAPAKAGQRALAESLARSYGPKGVHVSLVVIDGVVDLPAARERLPDRPENHFVRADDVAETVFMLARQPDTAWTFEMDLRPFAESW